jgi:hypothetical protein
VGNGRPRTYVACTNPLHRPVEEARRWVKAQAGWDWQELATAHDCMVTAPADVAAMLAAIGQALLTLRRMVMSAGFGAVRQPRWCAFLDCDASYHDAPSSVIPRNVHNEREVSSFLGSADRK